MESEIKVLKEKLHEGEVNFKYMKKNGEERTARGTLNVDVYGKEHEPKGTGNGPVADIVTYYDLDSEGWRSFREENYIGIVE